MIKKYVLELYVKSCKGLLKNKVLNSKITGFITIESDKTFYNNFNGTIIISGKLETASFDYSKWNLDTSFDSRKIDISTRSFKISKTDKNVSYTITGEFDITNDVIKNINVNVDVFGINSLLIDDVFCLGNSISVEIIKDDDIIIPPNLPTEYNYTTKLLWKYEKDRKGSGLQVDNNGNILEIIYDNISRKNSWLKVNGKTIKELNVETGNIFFTDDNKTWISVEQGVKKTNPNMITRPCEFINNTLKELSFDTDFCGCGIGIKNEPMFLDSVRNDYAVMKNKFGKIVSKFNGKGIPYDAIVNPTSPNNVITTLLDGSKNGIAWSTGEFISCNARAIVNWNGKIIVGVDGKLKIINLEKYKLEDYLLVTSKLGDSIDSMCVDNNNNLWISTSSPDALYSLSPIGKLIKVDEYSDDSDGGSVFRTRVATSNNKIVWGRNNKKNGNCWELREVLINSNNNGDNNDNTNKEQIDLTKAEWWGNSNEKRANQAEIVYTLKKVEIGSSTSRWITESNAPFSNGAGCYFVYRDGRWVGGPFDGLNPNGQVKTNGNIKSGLPGRYFKPTRRAYVKPKLGEDIVFCILSSDCKYRSTSYKVMNDKIISKPGEEK